MEHPVDHHAPEVAEEEVRRPLHRPAGEEQPLRLRLPQAVHHGAQGVPGGIHGGGVIGGVQPPLIVAGHQLPSLILDEGGVGGQDAPQPLRRGVVPVAGQGLLHAAIQGCEASGEQILLGAEVVVKGPGGDARPLADVPDGHLVEAVGPGQLQGGLEDGRLRLAGLFFPTLPIIHFMSSSP